MACDAAGVSVAKLEAHGWDDGVARVREAVERGTLRVSNLIGLGPFALAEPDRWDAQRERLVRSLDAAVALDAGCLVFTTGPAGPLTWVDAADALEAAMAPVLAEARRPRRSVRDRAHQLVACRRGLRAHARRCRRPRPPPRYRRVHGGQRCWAERDLAHTVRSSIDVIRLVQLSDYKVGTLSTPARQVPGDGDIPLRASSRSCSTPVMPATSTSSSSARRSTPRATSRRCRARSPPSSSSSPLRRPRATASAREVRGSRWWRVPPRRRAATA